MKRKKRLGIIAFIVASIMLVPNIVFAEAYYLISNMELDNNVVYDSTSLGGDYINIYVGNSGNFTFTLTTNELTNDKNYTLKLESDFYSYSHDYNGSDLNNGVDLEITDAKSYVEITLVEKGTTNEIGYKYMTQCGSDPSCQVETFYLQGIFYFTSEIDETALDQFYNTTFKNGKAKVDTIRISDAQARNSAVTTALKKYSTDRFDIEDITYDDNDPTAIQVIDLTKRFHSKEYEIEYEYATVDASIKAKVDAILSKFDESFNNMSIEDRWFIIEDLENINYKYSTRNITSEEAKINLAANYCSKLHELLGNNNMTVRADVRMGWDSDITAGAGGYLNILYDGIIYATVNAQGTVQKNVIYVDDDTVESDEAFITAAKARIKKYLPNSTVEIEVGGLINSLTYEDLGMPTEELEQILDITKTLGNYYIVSLDGKDFKFFIAKGTDNMNEPFLRTRDLNSNVFVETDSPLAPLDSFILADKLDKNSDEYKSLAKKLNIIQGLVYDLNLYSSSLKMNITKLEDGKFKVYIPVDEATTKKTLSAVYVKEDGTLENHAVKFEKIEDTYYAVFETDHFSTYALVDSKNPKTGDNLVLYLLVLTASGYVLLKTRKFN